MNKTASFFLNFPENFRIPLDDWVDVVMDWLILVAGDFFEALGNGILWCLIRLEHFFVWLPWPVVIIAVGVMGWFLIKKVWAPVMMAGLLILVGGFGYWVLAMKTLALVTGSVVVSLALGVPVGVIMAKSDLGESIIKPILDAMQTMPSFVYLIPAMMFFGLGKVPAMFATIIYAIPPIIRLTNVGIREVPENVVEAAKSFGSSSWQLLCNVELPLARPAIMVGINQTTMMALAMVVVASMIGAKGLGMEVLLAINRIEVGRGFEAGLSIVFLAIIIDRLTHAMAAKER